MACELRSGENFLRFSYFRHFAEDEANGNPYNFFFTVRVSSDGFSGHTRWECDRKEFVKFVQSAQDLYDFRTSSAELNDIGYGSRVRFEADKTGHITVIGILYGHAADHSVTFRFTADQSDLHPFITNLHKQKTPFPD
ncbi:MAG: hypothetical protein IJB20_01770 [Clostridia bacterium]|nr:hypothetical protein [Clostridia bacterium]